VRLALEFDRATGTVTASCFLLVPGNAKLLIDCGLFRGLKAYRLRNRDPFKYLRRKAERGEKYMAAKLGWICPL